MLASGGRRRCGAGAATGRGTCTEGLPVGTDRRAGLRGAGVRSVAEEVLLSLTFSCLESNILIACGITFLS